jgi:transposase
LKRSLRRYKVELTEEERTKLEALTTKGTAKARRIKRALILLAADEGDTVEAIAAKLRVGTATVERVRKRFVEESLDAALSERQRPGKPRLLDGRQEAHVLALACSDPPVGRARWTLQLLADRLVELNIVESICDETVRRTLKRGMLSPGSASSGALPP